MLVDFNTLPDSARIWVFQSNKTIELDKKDILKNRLTTFCQNWVSHNHTLHSSFKILYDKFIVLAIDESVSDISGCSIDKSVNLLKELEVELDISLLDKSLISFKSNETIATIILQDLKNKVEAGVITEDTIVFNTLVNNKSGLATEFETLAKNTWMKRYFKKELSEENC